MAASNIEIMRLRRFSRLRHAGSVLLAPLPPSTADVGTARAHLARWPLPEGRAGPGGRDRLTAGLEA